MAEPKSKATSSTSEDQSRDGLATFYYPDAREGQGGSVRAKNKAEADKLAEAGKFVNPNEAPAEDAGEDKA